MPAYFYFTQESPEGDEKRFVFRLDDDELIRKARNLLETGDKFGSHVQGTIVREPAAYNPEWSFHLRPDSINFFEMQIEVCDANVTYVEEHLCELGGSALPNLFWCPWSSQLAGEVTSEIDPKSELPLHRG